MDVLVSLITKISIALLLISIQAILLPFILQLEVWFAEQFGVRLS